ncbi:protein kinase [Colletotrichum tofieldiae]|nr:protein kinase [Colletotrichum tofieldiae]GKT85568.1 protein kinase [Colletotrichum tofieldiae]
MEELKSRLKKCKQSITSPFTIIKAFLYVEKKRRFREVNDKITAFQYILQNYGRVPIGNESALDNSSSSEEYDGSRGHPRHVVEKGLRKYREGKSRNSYLRASANDPKNLIRLYLDVCTLKNALTAWNSQIRAFRDEVEHDEFGAASQIDIDPREYLRRLMDEYDVKIDKCDLVLQGASLAFQMVQRPTPVTFIQLHLTWALGDLTLTRRVYTGNGPSLAARYTDCTTRRQTDESSRVIDDGVSSGNFCGCEFSPLPNHVLLYKATQDI